jgi:nitroreductase
VGHGRRRLARRDAEHTRWVTHRNECRDLEPARRHAERVEHLVAVYPAVQNFCVAARSLGLGTTLTTVIRIHTAEVFAALGVPEGRFEIAALVPVGRPAGRFGIAPRKPVEAVTHWNRYGERRR